MYGITNLPPSLGLETHPGIYILKLVETQPDQIRTGLDTTRRDQTQTDCVLVDRTGLDKDKEK
jgi:hypothetical protein